MGRRRGGAGRGEEGGMAVAGLTDEINDLEKSLWGQVDRVVRDKRRREGWDSRSVAKRSKELPASLVRDAAVGYSSLTAIL